MGAPQSINETSSLSLPDRRFWQKVWNAPRDVWGMRFDPLLGDGEFMETMWFSGGTEMKFLRMAKRR